MKKTFILLLLLVQMLAAAAAPPYRIAAAPWPENLGNHRAVIKIKQAADAVEVLLEWRRQDDEAASKCLIIEDAEGNRVKNIYRRDVNRELASFVFQPLKNTTSYYVYYLPWQGKAAIGSFQGNYLTREGSPDNEWVTRNRLHQWKSSQKSSLPQAFVECFESRTAFDSFYPMEVIARKQELSQLLKKYPLPYLVFPESRKLPIRMQWDLPQCWLNKVPFHAWRDTVYRNEYYVFQLGLFAATQNIEAVTLSYHDNSYKVTCFNTEGIDHEGIPFKKQLNVAKGKVQALWVGVDIPENAPAGLSGFDVIVSARNLPPQTIRINLHILDKKIINRGDNELWRHSRLRWLNSSLGISKDAIAPYDPVKVSGQQIALSTANLQMNANGLPQQISIAGKPLLADAISFSIEGEQPGILDGMQLTDTHPGMVAWRSTQHSDRVTISQEGRVESDGYLRYRFVVKAKQTVHFKNISLNIPVNKSKATYFMGMGAPGAVCPESYEWKWKGPQDSYWIGDIDAGIFCELRGASYSGPLLNLYHPAPPPSWYNNNAGGFRLQSQNNTTTATTYTGEYNIAKGDSLVFECALLITPVKKLNTAQQFLNKYYHDGSRPAPPGDALSAGIKIVNVHHANPVNPYINYPFIRADSVKAFTKRWHDKGLKVKLYYTIRELSNQATELWAFRSLGNEILADGNGGGYTWLSEHLVGNYNAQWFNPINDEAASDAALLTSGASRWYNYYVEGLKWMLENTGIDGLYLDDVAFDRELLKRLRRVMNAIKPGCMIDLHSNTGFSKGPATQYMEFFPYIDKLWFGESFQYDRMPPDNWLVEVSGIPFGLMGDMLHAGGNAWRGMLYGMTVRYPWFTEGVQCDPRQIWKVWDEFGIDSAVMQGYWESRPIVSTSNSHVLATTYVKKDAILVAVASWAKNIEQVKLIIDTVQLGWTPQPTITAPAIVNFQEQTSFKTDETIPVQPVKGWLLLLKRKQE
ncbi:MAG: glycoside hydrolase domain-containing protein [Agriterribacter sp.]